MAALSHYFIKGETLRRIYDTTASVIGLVNSFLILTHVSVFQFGLYQLILSLVNILDGLNIKGLDTPIMIEMRHYLQRGEKERAKRLYWEIAIFRLGFALIMGVVIFFASGMIAALYDKDVGLLVKLVSPLVFLYALESIWVILLKSVISFAHWSFPAIRELVKLLVILGIIFFYRLEIVGIVSAHVIGVATAVIVIGFVAFLRKYQDIFAGIKKSSQYIIFSFLKVHGLWLFLRLWLSGINKNIAPWLIKFFINTEAVAFYGLALNLIGFLEGLMPFAGVSPILLLKLGKNQELSFLFKTLIKYVFWLGMLLLAGGFFMAPAVIALILPNYLPAVPIFRIMIFALPLYGVYKIIKIVFSLLREHKMFTARLLSEVLLMPLGFAIFLPALGIIGSGFVYVGIYVERLIVLYPRLVKKYPEFKFKINNLFKFTASDKELMSRLLHQSLTVFKSFFWRT